MSYFYFNMVLGGVGNHEVFSQGSSMQKGIVECWIFSLKKYERAREFSPLCLRGVGGDSIRTGVDNFGSHLFGGGATQNFTLEHL